MGWGETVVLLAFFGLCIWILGLVIGARIARGPHANARVQLQAYQHMVAMPNLDPIIASICRREIRRLHHRLHIDDDQDS